MQELLADNLSLSTLAVLQLAVRGEHTGRDPSGRNALWRLQKQVRI
jgi:hypothetical protein